MSASPLQTYFADELRRAREAAGLTQEQLAAKMYVSKSLIAMVETAQRAPVKDFAAAADEALGADGRFDRMRERLLRGEATPEWFRPWVDYEREATDISWFEPLVVPGLLQTEEYARALLESGDSDQVENLVATRLERQQVLERARVSVVIDESVLHRSVGGAEVMHRQLTWMVSCRAVVQVLPYGAETYRHLDGSFAFASVDGVKVGYVDTPARGFVLEGPSVGSKLQQRWDVIRGEALPRRQSRELILKAAEAWASSD